MVIKSVFSSFQGCYWGFCFVNAMIINTTVLKTVSIKVVFTSWHTFCGADRVCAIYVENILVSMANGIYAIQPTDLVFTPFKRSYSWLKAACCIFLTFQEFKRYSQGCAFLANFRDLFPNITKSAENNRHILGLNVNIIQFPKDLCKLHGCGVNGADALRRRKQSRCCTSSDSIMWKDM